MGLLSFFQGVGRFVNSAFNTIKNFGRGVSGTIKGIAGAIGNGARFFSALPGIGRFAAGISAVADGVSTGVDIANTIFDAGEAIQTAAGLDTGRQATGGVVQQAAPRASPVTGRTIAPAVSRRRPVRVQ